ncbi:MAG: hypothetical protein MUO77_01500 [Anaerolineales bacterium]|nr:hypothetical protein [Anaerolineales bacterium]
MLTTLLIWVYICFILLAYGHGMLRFLSRAFDLDLSAQVSLPILALLGLCALNILAAVLSLFLPLGLEANIILLAGAFFLVKPAWIYVRSQPRFIFSWKYFLLVGIAFVIILENSTHIPVDPDTNLYHAQMIHWLEAYRTVPGLGNLHTRLAFNSNWLVLNALFSFAFLGFRSFHLLPGFLFLISILYFSSGFIELTRGSITNSAIIKTILLPLSFHIWASELSSPGTDLPTSLLIWVALIIWLESSETTQPKTFRIIAFILSLTAVTFKVSAFPLLLLPIFLWLKNLKNKNFKFAGAMALFVFLCWSPWFARNFITSGYWIYPVPALIPISPIVDWQIPPDTVVHELDGIQTWARQFTLKADLDSSRFLDWFPFWFSRQTLSQRLLLLVSILLPPFFGFYSIFKRRMPDIVHITAYAGVLFWFFTVPTIRFGYGFLIMIVLLIFAVPLRAIIKRIKRSSTTGTVLQVAVILYLGYILYGSMECSTFYRRLYLPEDYRVFSTTPCEIANATIQCAAKYNQCGYQAFPCVVKAFSNIELRGDDWQDGFRILSTP